MIRSRPKRTVSSNIDYNLKRRKVIKEEDNASPGLKMNTPSAGEFEHENHDGHLETEEGLNKPVVKVQVGGEVVFNEPSISEPINGVTGAPLSALPNERVKKESLWNYKVSREIPVEMEQHYKQALVKDEDKFQEVSSLRSEVTPNDIHAEAREHTAALKRKYNLENRKRGKPDANTAPTVVSLSVKHKRIKAIKDKDSKLFGQNSTANHVHLPEIRGPRKDIENNDFCSACFQTGIFLCCDTCPKSFHFACLNPPLDPDNLPEGDWSCHECRFKQKNPNKTITAKNQRQFLSQHAKVAGVSLFGKLLFQLKSMNSQQFTLTQQIKDTFINVQTGPHGEYQDDNMKEPLTDRQLFNAPYRQSITKSDSYNPDTHFTGPDEQEFLKCYKCKTTKMGTWDHPETERTIMQCDYCSTPWHLDCLPVPRASRKNLGSKWKCPLHAIVPKEKRRLARHQNYISLPLGACNDGDIEIKLDTVPIVANVGKDMQNAWEAGKKYNVIPRVQEHNVKLEFLDKVYKAKQAQRFQEICQQSYFLDKLLYSLPNDEMKPWLYFSLPDTTRKLWDLKELCTVASTELIKEEVSYEEIKQLQLLKKLIESKPKKDVLTFFGLNK
ncbi:HGL069Cp [Eremothecium sinecaudum]|uniref:HGL069Cp n=1 Tax=Eremothecium sinecaudum TaxID=45286 RepID=A0A0X8HV21_9SACH|nr:HGL069Cp [Eremothecium sinecaudum]AMD22271.1 HGL069Cp [Eremothecium sinecaudum]